MWKRIEREKRMPARLLLVDGGMRSIAERLRMLAASFDVTVANSLRRTREVLDVTTRDAYDAAVVSHRLPDGEAHEVLSDPRWQLYFPATAVQVTWNSSDVSFDILRKCDFIFPDSLRPSEFLDIVEALVLRRRRPSTSELVRRYSKELDLSARQAELGAAPLRRRRRGEFLGFREFSRRAGGSSVEWHEAVPACLTWRALGERSPEESA